MQKIVNQIKEMEIIEEELNSNPVGILAALVEGDQVNQISTTFLYIDKNVYIFFNEGNEVYEKLQFDNLSTFTVIGDGEKIKAKKFNFKPTYNFVSISITGMLKKIEEIKTLKELKSNYIKKYNKELSNEITSSSLINVIMIDSEEIQAFEEYGG